jgi:O-methyltransferase involved in polyketide biosynthesis
VGAAADKVLVITEGLLIYLEPDEVRSLATDLGQPAAFKRWLLDLASPDLIRMLARRSKGNFLKNQDVQFKFAPAEHVEFFRPSGWMAAEYRSVMAEARRLKRFEIPLPLRLISIVVTALVAGQREKIRRFSGIVALERG